MDTAIVSSRFRRFAERECQGSSQLYERLARQVADDAELLQLCAHSAPGQPVPNLFFGSVHYLLLKGTDHALREFYPSLTTPPRAIDHAFPALQDFCRRYDREIIALLQSRRVQTNEVRRCTYLYPGFCHIYGTVKKPLFLIEIGTSAGLQLNWDRYQYGYGGRDTYGNHNSPVHLTARVRRGGLPAILPTSPPVVGKIGVDLHIADLTNPEDYLWLQALIWPDHGERLAQFEQAAKLLQSAPVRLIEADGVSALPRLAEEAPPESVVCVFHTHVANQFPATLKAQLTQTVRTLGGQRDVFHFYNNLYDSRLHLDGFIEGEEIPYILGETDGHGRWFDWYLRSGNADAGR